MNAMNTHYPDPTLVEPVARHTLAVIVDNEPGVLARISGMFSGRGYNIESLTVSETEHEKHVSRITIVTAGTNAILAQIKAQLERLVPVHRVLDLTVQGNAIERELVLVKVAGRGRPPGRGDASRLRLRSEDGRRDADLVRVRAHGHDRGSGALHLDHDGGGAGRGVAHGRGGAEPGRCRDVRRR
jgi:acetolactate synthase-1/3 small subunit